LPKMGNVNGQPRKVIDGDGVETVFEYSTSGYQTASIVSGDIKETQARDAIGNVTSVTTNASSSIPATTTFTLMLAVGVPTSLSSSSGGLTRQAWRTTTASVT